MTWRLVITGRGVLPAGRSRSVSSGGLRASKNAGISSAKTGENPVHRKSKVSAVQFVCGGSVGPKARLMSVVDGCQVYIPEPGVEVDPGRTLFLGMIRLLVCRFRKIEPIPSGGSEVIRRKGREKPSGDKTSDRTANRHR